MKTEEEVMREQKMLILKLALAKVNEINALLDVFEHDDGCVYDSDIINVSVALAYEIEAPIKQVISRIKEN